MKNQTLTPVPVAQLPAGITAVDAERVADALADSRSPHTRRAYASAWRSWETWCSERDVPPMPAAPELLAARIAELAESGKSISTIDMLLAAVRAAHLDAGLDDPTSNRGVQRVRAGLRRRVGVAPLRQAHPLTTDEIRRMVTGCDGESLRGLRDRAIILLGFAGALRRSEIVGLQVGDVAWKSKGVVLTIRRSKGDQEGKGQKIGVTRGRHSETDPVAALRAWLDGTELAADDPLFCPVAWSDRRALARPLSGIDVARILQGRAEAAGLGDLPISGHSLRAGHATVAAEHGVPAERIARTTRHANLATLARYVRPGQVLGDTSAADLGL